MKASELTTAVSCGGTPDQRNQGGAPGGVGEVTAVLVSVAAERGELLCEVLEPATEGRCRPKAKRVRACGTRQYQEWLVWGGLARVEEYGI